MSHKPKVKKNKDVDIFIYSHIPFKPIATDTVFKVLTNSHEKDSRFHTKLKILRDYTGDNISSNNLMWNEYSGLYWLWSNYPLKKYIGLNHYRRMYTNFNNLPNIDQIFKNGKKIILNKPIPLRVQDGLPNGGELMNNRDWYKYWHCIDDFNLLESIVKELYPEYSDGWDKMAESTYLYPSSMFIMDKDTFINYCNYIFDVLEEFNDRRNCHSSTDYIKYVEEHKDSYIREYLRYYDVEKQARIVGYLAERALAAFLMSGGKDSLENNAEIFEWGMVPKQIYSV